jgi:hypothetical protein
MLRVFAFFLRREAGREHHAIRTADCQSPRPVDSAAWAAHDGLHVEDQCHARERRVADMRHDRHRGNAIRGLLTRAGGMAAFGLAFALAWSQATATEIRVGAATVDITPDKPVALDGQFNVRISRNVETPITANAVAIEARSGDRSLDQAVMVSCDLVAIRPGIQDQLRDRLGQKLAGFDARKLFLTATHTHTAPVTEEGKYEIPRQGVMPPSEYVQFLLGRLEEVVAKAWNSRRPGGVSWALGHAVVGYNRRAVYADGKAQMYGDTSRPDFRGFESGEDHGMEMLFFWDLARTRSPQVSDPAGPIAVAINLACPSQEVESRSAINADFWHDVRQQLHQRLGKNVCILGWPSACGDQSPHRMYRKAAEERMLKLRGLTATQEIGRRIAREVEDVYELARGDVRTDVPFVHRVENISLPRRKVTEQEMKAAQAQVEALARKKVRGSADPKRQAWYQATVNRYRSQDKEGPFSVELHAVRIGDIAIVTNPFELFLDYGLQIKARSKAEQTFVLQLTSSSGHYLATRKAVEGGGYSAVVESNLVGPEGGQVLVERSVELLNGMW